jgi:hypothetical protein
MITPQRRNELGDALEIDLVKYTVIPLVLPSGMDFKHIPKTAGGADFEIIDKQTKEVLIVIECKNWDITPSDKQVETEIIDRFKKYKKNELKFLVGHVNFTEGQKEEYLIKNKIVYDHLESQILPEDVEYKKQKFVEKLKSSLASVILYQTDKYRPDLVSNMKVKIIGKDEALFKLGSFQHSLRTSTKEYVSFKRHGMTVSEFRSAGPEPLDIVQTYKIERDSQITNLILIPKRYEAYSENVKLNDGFGVNNQEDTIFREGSGLDRFFKEVYWRYEK